jgi:hypothetical protein
MGFEEVSTLRAGQKSRSHTDGKERCLFCALQRKPSTSPIAVLSQSDSDYEVKISACENCGEKIQASLENRRRWTIKVEVLPDPEDSETDAWLHVGIRGVKHWHLSDRTLEELGVSFELNFRATE